MTPVVYYKSHDCLFLQYGRVPDLACLVLVSGSKLSPNLRLRISVDIPAILTTPSGHTDHLGFGCKELR